MRQQLPLIWQLKAPVLNYNFDHNFRVQDTAVKRETHDIWCFETKVPCGRILARTGGILFPNCIDAIALAAT